MKLTQTVQKGGCAAKVAATELRKILSQVKFPRSDQNLLVDGGLFDDAAIYKVSSDLALVQTLDFFTPIVDTPYIFGRIAAANSLSDVYAMGGEPKTAMAILAFPLATLDSQVCIDVLQGASDVMSEACVNFVGGHSIDDDTLKFGLSVTGYVHPDQVWSNAKAKAGDCLILTKPLGTGTVTAALKRQELVEDEMREVLDSMGQINKITDLLTSQELHAIHSATDITGFGLSGHSLQMAKASQKRLRFQYAAIPQFQLAQVCLEKKCLTKAHRTNAEYTKAHLQVEGLTEREQLILFDPQTSGGLLLSVDAGRADEILSKIQKRFPRAAIVGVVEESSVHGITIGR